MFTISYMMSAVFSILQYVVQSLRSSWSCWCAPTVSPVAGNSGPSCSESWTALGIRENNCAVQWIKIYPMDSLIHLLKKWGQISKVFKIARTVFLILFTVAEISLISFCFPLKKRTELAIIITNWDQSYTVDIPHVMRWIRPHTLPPLYMYFSMWWSQLKQCTTSVKWRSLASRTVIVPDSTCSPWR